ncbi:MAG TPA: periplasmic heavy metal sensor [Candidatus Limnocylindrales bacterium]|nr:periplasmic heavy metal sensor [Candidatus Limnocylindrales bacterium]
MKLLTALLLLFTAATLAVAQQPAAQQDPATAAATTADPIEQLRLTPDQRQSIRQIVAENKDERQVANRRSREANVALDQALDADPTDENLIEQRINELSAAQATQLRLRIHTEMKIRRILRPEQLATLRRLHLELRDVMAPQRMNNPRVPANQGFRPRP